ncbi:hypothetical protein [Azospirillum sp. sgz302134]
MTRWVGLLLLGLGFAAPALAETLPTISPTPVSMAIPAATCLGEGPARRCTAMVDQSFANNRGGMSALSISAVRDATCTTLHIVFDGPIALDRPVTLTPDGAPAQRFYTPDELTDLARALDNGTRPSNPAPEFARFLTQVSSGAIKDADAGREMLNQFAAIKEPRRIGLTCGPMERLLPQIRTGRAVRLEFEVEPRTTLQAYHWSRLEGRAVDLRLDELLASLDRAMPGS